MVNSTTGGMELRRVLNQSEPTIRTASSPYYNLHYIQEHLHSQACVAPAKQNPVSLTAGTGAWSETGTITQIVASSTITAAFDIHYVNITDVSSNGYYEIDLYAGPSGSESAISTFALARTTNFDQEGTQPTITPLVAANTRIAAKLSSSNAAADTLGLKIVYHEY